MNAALSLISQAEEKFKAHEYLSAIKSFTQSAAVFPTLHAQYGLSLCYFSLKDYSRAIQIIESSQFGGSIYSDKSRLYLSKCFEGLGELISSKDILDQILSTTQDATIKSYTESHLKRILCLLSSTEEFLKIQCLNRLPSEICYIVDKQWHDHWREFSLKFTQVHPGKIVNANIIFNTITDCRDYAAVILKDSVVEDQDYSVFTSSAFEELKKSYGCDQEVKRFCIRKDLILEIEVHLVPIRVLTCPKVSEKQACAFEVLISQTETITEIIEACKRIIEPDFNCAEFNFDVFRVWKLSNDTPLDTTQQRILIPSATLLEALPSKHDSALYLLEFQRLSGQWSVITQAEEICPYCRLLAELLVPCPACKSINYCSEECLNLHIFAHSSSCETKIVRFGKTGLYNIGNTCYMNSILQCLSHTQVLTDYFRSKLQYTEQANVGAITQAYSNILSLLWGANTGAIYPSQFKKAFALKFLNFSGFYQQDAHEFLVGLLITIHDELKTKLEPKISDHYSKFLNENFSIISRNVFGMLENRIVCPNCGFCAERTDEFLTLPLQVLDDERIQITLYMIFGDRTRPNERRVVSCYYSWSTLEMEKLIEAQYGCKVILSVYDMFEYRGIVKSAAIGDYRGKVFVAHERLNTRYVVVKATVAGIRVALDRLMFINEDAEDKSVYEHVIDTYGNGLKRERKAAESGIHVVAFKDGLCREIGAGEFGYIDASEIEVRIQKEDILAIRQVKDQQGIYIEAPVNPNLHSSIRSLVASETLDETNKWLCEGCQSHTLATKDTRLTHFPKVLIFHLLKFKNSLLKLNTFVDFPVENLDLTEFGCPHTYDLYAVCNHYGTYAFGHYTAYVKTKDSEWLEMNDSIISVIPTSSVISSAAYVLFYAQRE